MTVGYDVTITRHEWFALSGGGTEWRVDVRRLSDGAETSRVFAFRRSARRFGRSRRRLSKAFDRDAARRDGEVERFTLTWAGAAVIDGEETAA